MSVNAQFCLLPQAVDAFKQAIKDREIDPEKLAAMTSLERHELFAGLVGKENATGVNSLFESKLLLKNQQAGILTWAKKVAGITPEIKRDLVSRIEKMDRVLNPAELDQFLHDLAATKLGVEVTQEEAKQISDLSQKVTETRQAMEAGGDRMAYGRAKVALTNYVDSLKQAAEKQSLKEYALHPIKSTVKGVSEAAGGTKSLKGSLSLHALLHQGIPTLYSHFGIWQRNARLAFSDAAKTFGGKAVMDEVRADALSRPNFVNGKYNKMGLALGGVEEAFPSSLPEKIPVAGRLYKASEVAFNAFNLRERLDLADKYLKIADNTGVNTSDKVQLQSIGKLVNALTGRGDLGKLEPAANVVNNVFFSPRLFKSEFDILTAHQLQKGVTPFVRKQAAYNLLKIVGGMAAILATAYAIKKESVELDPKSKNFGKIKVGDTTFDISGGLSSVITLAAQQLTGQSKSTTTGQITSMTSGAFGQPTRLDSLISFAEGKLSPAASVIKDLLQGKDFNGNDITVGGELNNLFTPLPITTYQELQSNPNAANIFLGMIATAFGLVVKTKTNSQELINKVGQYAKDHKLSIEDAQKQLLGDGIITKDSSGHVIFERMSAADAAAKSKLLGKDGNKELILDHTIPLELGGSNGLSNLKLVPKTDSLAADRIENILGKAYKSNQITGDEARKLIVDYKSNKITAQAVYDRLGLHDQFKKDTSAAAKATRLANPKKK